MTDMLPRRPIRTNRSFAQSLLVVAVAVAPLLGCDRSCAKLADRLCEQVSLSNAKNADEQCEAWRARTRRVSPSTCQSTLRLLQEPR